MNKLLVLLAFTSVLLLTPASAIASGMLADSTNYSNLQEKNLKIKTIAKFLKNNESPLEQYAETLINEAEKNQLDWRLVTAITGVESSFGKAIPQNSYNAYGWNNGDFYFNSWEEGISIVSKTLNEKYRQNWGAEDPYQIGHFYAASPTWANRVVYFMEKIEKFSDDISLLPLNL